MGCTQFTGTLNIPPTVTRIGAHAFDGCTGLMGIVAQDVTLIAGDTAYGRNACAALIQSLTNDLEEEYDLILNME